MANQAAKHQLPAGTRLHELDVLRGLAALAVVFCHYTSECHFVGRMDSTFRLGSYGPHLFFIISGFVIFMSLKRCKRPSDFVFSRFARLYPVYWFVVPLSALLLLVSSQSSVAKPTFIQFLGNLTMLQTWLRIPNIEEAYWTLGVELKFYLLAFLALASHQLKRSDVLVAGWLVAVVVYRCLDALVGLPHVFGTVLIVDYAHLFAAGIMFYRVHADGHNLLRHAIILMAIPMQYWAEGTESMMLSSLFVVVFHLVVLQQFQWIVNKPLQWLGNISYPLYLVHGSIGVVSIHWLAGCDAPLWLMLLMPTALSLCLATAIHHQLERPTAQVLRKWWQQRARRTGTSVAPQAS